MRTVGHRLSRLSAVTVALAVLILVIPDSYTRASATQQRVGTAVPRVPSAPAPGQSGPVTVGALQLTADRASALIEARRRRLDYVPGEVTVRFKPGMSASQQQRALMALRSRPSVDGLRWLPGGAAVLRDNSQPDAHILAEQLGEQPEVESAEPNYLAHLPVSSHRAIATITSGAARTFGTPNDPQYGNYQWNFAQLDMPRAWDINPGGKSDLIVATIDTGVTTVKQTFTFPLFTGSKIENVALPFDVSTDLQQSRIVGARDFVFMPTGGPVLDFDGHGTHVTSTIGEATNNGFQLAGMAYNVRLMPVKVCLGYWELMIANAQAGHTGFLPPDSQECPFDAITSGIRYAVDNGAKVINISLGGGESSSEMRAAIAYAVQHGAFVAIAMGNDFEDGNPPSYPAVYAPEFDGAMSVAATSKFMHHAYYSSTGSHCEIAAPGGDDTDGGGLDGGYVFQVTLLYTDQDPALAVPRFDRYAGIGFEGTSMATPHVAGLAALLMSQGVTSPAAVEALIKATAKDLGSPGRDDTFGYGLIQPRAALFGFGIIK
jgi:serine protease